MTSKCFGAARISAVLIDDGLELDKMHDVEWHKKFVPFVGRILRIERVAEKILDEVRYLNCIYSHLFLVLNELDERLYISHCHMNSNIYYLFPFPFLFFFLSNHDQGSPGGAPWTLDSFTKLFVDNLKSYPFRLCDRTYKHSWHRSYIKKEFIVCVDFLITYYTC